MGMVYFGDIAEERRETIKTKPENCPIVGLEHITPGDIRLSDWDTGVENTFTKAFRKGDILFGRRRAYLKKAAVAPFDGICSGDITTIKAKEDKILPELLPFIVQNDAFFDFAVGKSAGSLSPRVKWEHLKTYQLNLPSMEEQKRLVKILMAAEETRQAYKKLITEIGELVKSKFTEMFGDIKEFKKLTDISSPKQWKTIATKDLLSSGYPVYGANGIIGYYNEYNHAEQTILIGCRGTCGFINVSVPFSYVNGNAMCLDKLDNRYDIEFLKNFLKTYDFSKIITGSTIPQITIEGLKNVLVPDITLEEQKTFTEFAEQAEQTKLATQQSLDALDETVRALVNRNFN